MRNGQRCSLSLSSCGCGFLGNLSPSVIPNTAGIGACGEGTAWRGCLGFPPESQLLECGNSHGAACGQVNTPSSESLSRIL